MHSTAKRLQGLILLVIVCSIPHLHALVKNAGQRTLHSARRVLRSMLAPRLQSYARRAYGDACGQQLKEADDAAFGAIAQQKIDALGLRASLVQSQLRSKKEYADLMSLEIQITEALTRCKQRQKQIMENIVDAQEMLKQLDTSES